MKAGSRIILPRYTDGAMAASRASPLPDESLHLLKPLLSSCGSVGAAGGAGFRVELSWRYWPRPAAALRRQAGRGCLIAEVFVTCVTGS